MPQVDNTKKAPAKSGLHESSASAKPLAKISKPTKLLLGGMVVLVIVIILVAGALGGKTHRTESYKNIQGAAGLEATITYDHKKPTFDFNVYIFQKSGQQAAIVLPDKDGKVNLALPEGDYIMLIGKQFGKEKLFPQEHVALKNGKKLELKLHYKEGGL